jgi:hypothetical protein
MQIKLNLNRRFQLTQNGSFHPAEEAGRSAGSAPIQPAIPRPEETRPANRPSIVEILLQDPVLAGGEKVEDYRALVTEVSEAVQPKNLFDRLLVSDLCHAVWEEQRFQRQQAALPAATGLKALQCLLASIGYEANALAIATDYFGFDEEQRTKAIALVRRFGITDDAIAAQASEHNLPTISALDRLMANRQSRRDMIVKQYLRRQRKTKKLAAAQSEQPNGTPAEVTH